MGGTVGTGPLNGASFNCLKAGSVVSTCFSIAAWSKFRYWCPQNRCLQQWTLWTVWPRSTQYVYQHLSIIRLSEVCSTEALLWAQLHGLGKWVTWSCLRQGFHHCSHCSFVYLTFAQILTLPSFSCFWCVSFQNLFFFKSSVKIYPINSKKKILKLQH